MMITLEFLALTIKFILSNQFEALLTLFWRCFSTTARVFPLHSKVVSSAYSIQFIFLKQKEKSFTYITNKIGPKIEPWGIPISIEFSLDIREPHLTFWHLLLKYDVKKLIELPSKP